MTILSKNLATSSEDELAGGGCGLGSTSEFIKQKRCGIGALYLSINKTNNEAKQLMRLVNLFIQ
jgi:hypothetical protein